MPKKPVKTKVEKAKKTAKPSKPVKVVKKKTSAPKMPAPKAVTEDEKLNIIKAFALKEGDTGSPEVQVAIATQKITNLIKHLEENPKDNHSRRGLLKIVAKRRRILNYLQKKDEKRYKDLIKKLDLKK